jgi:hypothetical protein
MTRLLDQPMLCIHPGSSHATADVYDGIVDGLMACGVQVVEYALGPRLVGARQWLRLAHRSHVRTGGPMKDHPPSDEDTLYLAGQGALERALRANVGWVVVVAGGNLHPAILPLLRRAGRKIAVLFTEGPYWDHWQRQYVQHADLCWVNERTSVAVLRQVCPWTFYLPTAYHAEHHAPGGAASDDVLAHDVVFVGTGFQERIALLSAIDWTGIDLGLYGWWSLLGSRHRLRQHLHKHIIPNRQAVALYQKAKIGLNLYRTSMGISLKALHLEGAESLNPRAYELAALGVCQISEYRAEMEDVFAGAVPWFSSPQTCEALIRRLLVDAPLRAALAGQAQARVQPHTYLARAQQALRNLAAYEEAAGAPSDPALGVAREERESATANGAWHRAEVSS